ncbi:hypothetical protein C0J52_27523, partial [Blattella germanica]
YSFRIKTAALLVVIYCNSTTPSLALQFVSVLPNVCRWLRIPPPSNGFRKLTREFYAPISNSGKYDSIYLQSTTPQMSPLVATIFGIMGACRRHELHQLKVNNVKDIGKPLLPWEHCGDEMTGVKQKSVYTTVLTSALKGKSHKH